MVGIPDLIFEGELFDGLNTVKSKKPYKINHIDISRYNNVLRRYELFLTPINTNKEGFLTITCLGVNIKDSPFIIDIIPGPCNILISLIILNR